MDQWTLCQQVSSRWKHPVFPIINWGSSGHQGFLSHLGARRMTSTQSFFILCKVRGINVPRGRYTIVLLATGCVVHPCLPLAIWGKILVEDSCDVNRSSRGRPNLAVTILNVSGLWHHSHSLSRCQLSQSAEALQDPACGLAFSDARCSSAQLISVELISSSPTTNRPGLLAMEKEEPSECNHLTNSVTALQEKRINWLVSDIKVSHESNTIYNVTVEKLSV